LTFFILFPRKRIAPQECSLGISFSIALASGELEGGVINKKNTFLILIPERNP
jgi:hypothetical protein